MEDEYPDQLFKSLIKDIELQLDLGIRNFVIQPCFLFSAKKIDIKTNRIIKESLQGTGLIEIYIYKYL